MISGGHPGSIVFTASSGATTVCDQLSAYCASKAAVLMLARHMATELGPARIRTNAVLPGVIATDMTAPMLERARWQNMVARETPVGRAGRPEEVARLVAFLLSDDAAYINGEGIAIDGRIHVARIPALVRPGLQHHRRERLEDSVRGVPLRVHERRASAAEPRWSAPWPTLKCFGRVPNPVCSSSNGADPAAGPSTFPVPGAISVSVRIWRDARPAVTAPC